MSPLTRRVAALPMLLALFATSCAPAPAPAQDGHVHPGPAPDSAGHDHAAGVAATSMGGALMAGPHIKLTPRRPPSAADSARAAAVVATLRHALRKYQDVRAAEADGYQIFAPHVKTQRVFHFTNYGQSFKEHFRFDPAQPTSLLYRKNGNGDFILVGAMYVAPKRATPDELDARVPLSVAQWHAHVNICLPGPRQRSRWGETRGGVMKFGPAGAIATREDCEAERGRFHPQLFGWMVHANVFASDDPAVIWGHEHGGAGEHAGH